MTHYLASAPDAELGVNVRHVCVNWKHGIRRLADRAPQLRRSASE